MASTRKRSAIKPAGIDALMTLQSYKGPFDILNELLPVWQQIADSLASIDAMLKTGVLTIPISKTAVALGASVGEKRLLTECD